MILILNDHQNIKISKSYTNDIVKSKKIPWQISILFIIYKWVHVNIFKIAENKLNTLYFVRKWVMATDYGSRKIYQMENSK